MEGWKCSDCGHEGAPHQARTCPRCNGKMVKKEERDQAEQKAAFADEMEELKVGRSNRFPSTHVYLMAFHQTVKPDAALRYADRIRAACGMAETSNKDARQAIHNASTALQTAKEALEAAEECLTPVKDVEDRTVLWAHVVSAHACIMSPTTSLEDLLDYHHGEHNGPGGIRNHDEADRSFTLKKMGEVLIESDDGE